MRDQIIDRLKKIEEELIIYNAFMNNPSSPEKDRKVVAFKYLYEMIAFTSIHSLVPDYTPGEDVAVILAQGLAGLTGYVSIQGGKVIVSQEYEKLLAQKDEYMKKLKDKGNGEVV